jgi:hypothetical protein
MYRRLRILASDYGRDYGWYVETEGRRIAVLTDVQWEDMFWHSYRLEVLTTNLGEVENLYSDDFWRPRQALLFRSREFREVAPFAFAGGRPGSMLRESGRILVRGLYLAVPSYPFERLLLLLSVQAKRS